jgi:LPS export ABC transporter protein LptC
MMRDKGMRNVQKQSGPTGHRGLHLVAVMAIAGLAAACVDGSEAVAGSGFRSLPADQVVVNMETDMKDLGMLRARLRADTAHIWEDSAKTLMFPVSLRLYDDNGAETAHLTAREGELDSRTNEMVARGNVVLVSPERGRRILTEELHYDPRSGRIWSDVHTVFYDGGSRMEGEGFRADDRMHDVEVFKSTGENIPFGS